MNNGELSLEDLFQSNAVVLDKHSVREGITHIYRMYVCMYVCIYINFQK